MSQKPFKPNFEELTSTTERLLEARLCAAVEVEEAEMSGLALALELCKKTFFGGADVTCITCVTYASCVFGFGMRVSGESGSDGRLQAAGASSGQEASTRDLKASPCDKYSFPHAPIGKSRI